ncbi:MAG: hypothetical protein V1784_08590 [bacterium]
MKSRALMGAVVVCLLAGSAALAQPGIVIDGGTIVCKEDTAETNENGVIDEATDSLVVTVKATLPSNGQYLLCEPDCVEAGLWPTPGLGDFDPTVPEITYLCNPVQLYRMNVMVIQNMGLDSLYDEDSCLAIAAITLHPLNLFASAGTIAQFSVTVKSADYCWPCRYCRSDPLYVELPCSVRTAEPLSAVLDLVIHVEGSNLILNWSPVEGAENYNVYRGTDPFGSFNFFTVTSDTTFVHGTTGSRLYFQIRASN